jgi:hypothetical protein
MEFNQNQHSVYRKCIESMLQPGLLALRNSANGLNLSELRLPFGRSGEENDYVETRPLNLYDPETKWKEEEGLFGSQIYKKHRTFTKAIDKDSVTAFSWKYHARNSDFDESRVKVVADINERWKYGLHDRNLSKLSQCNTESLFIPNISITDFIDEEIKTNLLRFSKEMDTNIAHVYTAYHNKERTENKTLEWQKVLEKPISGFGIDACQLYIKSGVTATLFHDEICWSRAVNQMHPASRGEAIWIGVNLKELEPYFTKKEMLEWYTQHDINAWLIQLAELRNRLYSSIEEEATIIKMPEITICWQTPGSMVFSPEGCGHLVLTVSDYVEQMALNYSATERGIRECLEFWHDLNDLKIEYNSGLATEHVVPCLWLQDQKGYDFGPIITEKIKKIKSALFPSSNKNKRKSQEQIVKKIEWSHESKENLFCDKCEKHCLFVLCDGVCEECLLL